MAKSDSFHCDNSQMSKFVWKNDFALKEENESFELENGTRKIFLKIVKTDKQTLKIRLPFLRQSMVGFASKNDWLKIPNWIIK